MVRSQTSLLLVVTLSCMGSLVQTSAVWAQSGTGEPWSVREPGRIAQPAPRTNEPIQGASFSTESPSTGRPLETSATDLNWPQAEPQPAGSARPLPTRQRPASGGTSGARSSGTPLWLSVFGLVVVLGGAATGLLWLRRHGPTAWRPLPNEAVELLGRRTLEPRVSVHLLRCGHRMLLVGVGPDGARTLAEIHDPVEVDLLAGACRRPAENGADFLQSLHRFMPARSNEQQSAGPRVKHTDPKDSYPRREGQRG